MIVQQLILTGFLKQERFSKVERVCRRVALIDENGGSILRYALSYLQVESQIPTNLEFKLKVYIFRFGNDRV